VTPIKVDPTYGGEVMRLLINLRTELVDVFSAVCGVHHAYGANISGAEVVLPEKRTSIEGRRAEYRDPKGR